MPYSVQEVGESDRALFSQLVRTIWTANHQPYQPYFSAYNPVFGPTHEDRERAIEESAERKWAAHLADSNSHWIVVRDDSQPDIVLGACRWLFYLENPYKETGQGTELPYDVSMWPEGSTAREFVASMLRKQYSHRARWLRRRHTLCHDMVVLPSYRGQGIASMMMDWGMRRAEESSLDVFLHASDMGTPLYLKWGFRVIQKIEIDMTKPHPSDEWERLRHDFGPLRISLLWKPYGGIYEEGVTKLPWEAL